LEAQVEITNPPFDEHMPNMAVKLEKGVLLWTLDGSKIGNAIVKEVKDKAEPITLYEVETDFGNIVPNFNEREIMSLFRLGYVGDYEHWKERKRSLVNGQAA
jgi:hypothetical protein